MYLTTVGSAKIPHSAIGAPVGRIELRINRLVYDLSGLAEEEIAVVEGAV